MASLSGSTIASTYQSILALPLTGGDTTTLVALTDGDGVNTFALKVATTSISVGATNKIYLDGGGNTYLHEVSADAVQIVAGGTAVFEVDSNSRISLSNNDAGGTGGADSTTGNTIFGYLAGTNSEDGSHNNTLIGHKAAGAGTWANFENNVIIGSNAGLAATGADQCVIIGHNAGLAITGSEDVVLIGQDAGKAMTDNVDKVVFIGRNCGSTTNDTAATGTVGIGHSALAALTNGSENCAVGYTAGAGITTASGCTAIGYGAMDEHVDGHRNTAIGANAMGNTVGGTTSDGSVDNIFIGYNAGAGAWADAASSYNVGIGSYALDAVMNGALNNTAVGANSLSAITTGDSNTAIGKDAGSAIQDGHDNVIIGKGAVTGSTTLGSCVFIGYLAGGSDAITADADGTVAIGKSALNALASGQQNTAIGYHALTVDDHGDNNTAVGWGALATFNGAAGATDNTAVGAQAGFNVTSGIQGTFMGFQAGGADSAHALAGSGNTCFGWKAGKELQGAAGSNTCIGSGAGDVITSGTLHTCLGAFTDPSGATNVNQVVIGYGATGIGDNYAVVGNADTTRVYAGDDVGAILYAGNATVQTSDRRIKENIEDCELGLSFINKLKPITYKKRQPKDYDDSLKATLPWHREGKKLRILDDVEKNKFRFGLIAQDVEAELLDMNIDINNDIVENDTDTGQYHLAYSKIITPLVKAVQELSQQVEDLKAKIN